MKRNIIFYGIPLLLAIIIFLLIRTFNPFAYSFNEITLDDYIKINEEKDGTYFIYVYNDDLDEGEVYTNIIKTVMEDKKTKVYSLDYQKIESDKNTKKFIEANEYTKTISENNEGYMIPMVLIIENGKVKASIMGTTEEKDFSDFVKINEVK